MKTGGFQPILGLARPVAQQYGADHDEHVLTGGEVEELPRLIGLLEQPCYEPGMMLTWCAPSPTSSSRCPGTCA